MEGECMRECMKERSGERDHTIERMRCRKKMSKKAYMKRCVEQKKKKEENNCRKKTDGFFYRKIFQRNITKNSGM